MLAHVLEPEGVCSRKIFTPAEFWKGKDLRKPNQAGLAAAGRQDHERGRSETEATPCITVTGRRSYVSDRKGASRESNLLGKKKLGKERELSSLLKSFVGTGKEEWEKNSK